MATKRKRKLQRAAKAAARRRAHRDEPPAEQPVRTFHKTKGGPEMQARQYAAISASYNKRRR